MNILSLKLFITFGVVCCLAFINGYCMQPKIEQEIVAKMDSMIAEYEASIKLGIGNSSSMARIIGAQCEKKIQEFKKMIDDLYGAELNEDIFGNGENTPLAKFAARIHDKRKELSAMYAKESSDDQARDSSNNQKKVKNFLVKSKEIWPDSK